MTLNNQSTAATGTGSSATAPIDLVTPDISIIEIEDSIDESLPSLSALGWPKKPGPPEASSSMDAGREAKVHAKIAEQVDLFAALEKQLEEEVRPAFQPHPNLADYLVPIVKKRWDEIPTSHLFPPPLVGERPPVHIQSFEDGLNRLHNYAFSQGFAIVIHNRPIDGSRVQVRCVHYGEKTRNTYKLPDHRGQKIEVDGRIIERVQENTTIRKDGCKWAA
ncbi:hypothetical protein Vi05172_g2626 [Venturia inaequalis]|nr:hypothetical protein Vi05172_g2626 [Venturia inaequalis]